MPASPYWSTSPTTSYVLTRGDTRLVLTTKRIHREQAYPGGRWAYLLSLRRRKLSIESGSGL